jgi:hypothetical protein
MELFIRLKNGEPFEHPILFDNFRQAFPQVDTENLPSEFAKFIRVEQPLVGVYQVYEGVTYERIGDAFTDVHHIRAMTEEEKAQKIADAMAQPHLPNWTFDQELCCWIPSQIEVTRV